MEVILIHLEQDGKLKKLQLPSMVFWRKFHLTIRCLFVRTRTGLIKTILK